MNKDIFRIICLGASLISFTCFAQDALPDETWEPSQEKKDLSEVAFRVVPAGNANLIVQMVNQSDRGIVVGTDFYGLKDSQFMKFPVGATFQLKEKDGTLLTSTVTDAAGWWRPVKWNANLVSVPMQRVSVKANETLSIPIDCSLVFRESKTMFPETLLAKITHMRVRFVIELGVPGGAAHSPCEVVSDWIPTAKFLPR